MISVDLIFDLSDYILFSYSFPKSFPCQSNLPSTVSVYPFPLNVLQIIAVGFYDWEWKFDKAYTIWPIEWPSIVNALKPKDLNLD